MPVEAGAAVCAAGVEPENVAGAIKISRLTNVNFEDKSSREGLQENKTFQIFKGLIASIINIFENAHTLLEDFIMFLLFLSILK